jgi:hypothetical protein
MSWGMINLEKRKVWSKKIEAAKARIRHILATTAETGNAKSSKTYCLNVMQISIGLDAEVSVNVASYQELSSLILKIKGDDQENYYITYRQFADIWGQSEDRVA